MQRKIDVLQLARKTLLILPLLLVGCTPVVWKLESIESGVPSFDAMRLTYANPASSSPLRLEFLCNEAEVSSYLSLTQFWFRPLPTDPPTVAARFTLGDTILEADLPLLEGEMRLPLTPEITGQLSQALLEGKRVSIFVDGFEETLLPERFAPLYEKLITSTPLLQTFFKGFF